MHRKVPRKKRHVIHILCLHVLCALLMLVRILLYGRVYTFNVIEATTEGDGNG
jgi:hypothetical protein